MTAMRSVPALLSATLLLLAEAAGASPLFEDRATNLWIGTPEGQQLIPLTANRWLDGYLESGQPVQALVAPDQALVNGLPFSSQPMQANQPAVSVIGLGEPVATVGGGPVSRPPLRVWPESGRYSSTLAVEIGLSPAQFDAPSVALRIRRNAGPGREIVFCARSRPAGCVEPVALREGYRGLREALAVNAVTDYEIEARRANGSVIASLSRRYEISGTDPRRDSDGDGIPDILEEILGLDAFRDDLQQDRDGDGWSDFDEWLRCPAYDAEMRCPALDDPDARPVDTDGDGWSDFDETLRGTRAEARYTLGSLALAPREGETPASAAYQDRQLRFFERPAARRLYEREYRLDAVPLRPRAGVRGRYVHAAAQSLFGDKLEPLDHRIDAALLQEAGLAERDLAPSRLRSSAEAKLLAEAYPITRLPAAEGLMLEAWQRQAGQIPEPGVHIQASKRALPPLADLTLHDFLALQDPVWTDVAGFREALVAWLEQNLTVDTDAALSADSTRVGLALEQVFSEEARLNAAASPVVFNDSLTPVKRAWLPRMLDTLDAEAAPRGGLQRLLEQLALALRPMGALMDVAEFIDEQTAPDAVPVGRYSDIWLAGRWNDSGAGLPENCVLPDVLFETLNGNAAAAAAAGCPAFVSQSARAQQFAADRARRFALRSLLLLDAPALLSDPSLRDPDADSDGDGLSNAAELEQRPVRFASRPDRTDSDGDGRPDAADPCPLDRLETCLGAVIPPQLDLPSMVTVQRGGPGGVAAIPVGLSRPAAAPVEIRYEAVTLADDSAQAGVDYEPVAGVLLLRAGVQLELVSIPVLAGGGSGERRFSFRITEVSGALVSDPLPRVRVRILETAAERPPPEARILAPDEIEAGATDCLDGRGSLDPLGEGLAYVWQQTAGPDSGLMFADTPQACFTAPPDSGGLTLGYTLTVTDGEGREATATVSITVVAPLANRAPELRDGALQFEVRRGDNLLIPRTAIRDAAVDPDGDALTAGEVVGAPEGGVIREDADAVLFRPYRGLIPISPEAQRVVRQEIAGVQGRVVLSLVEGVNAGRELWRYDADTDAAPRRLAVVEDVIAAEGSDVYYTTVEDGLNEFGGTVFSLQRRSLADEAVVDDLGRYPTLQRLQQQVRLDPRNGDLYFCDAPQDFSDGEWTRLPGDGGSPQAQALACFANSSGGGARGPEAVAFAQGYCFVEGDSGTQLYCAQSGAQPQPLQLIQSFQGRVTDLLVLDGTLFGSELKIIEVDGSRTRFWAMLSSQPPEGPSATFEGLTLVEGESRVRGRSVLVPLESEPAFDARELQIYRWDEAISTPLAISQPMPRGDFRSGRGGFAVDNDGRLYWFRVTPNPPSGAFSFHGVGLAVLDPDDYQPAAGGTPAQLADFVELRLFFSGAQAQASSTRISYDGKHILLSLAGVGGVPQCTLQRVGTTPPFEDEELARGLECFQPAPRVLRPELLNPLLIVPEAGRFDGLPLLPTFVESEEGGGQQELPVTVMRVRVRDPDQAFVDVPIEITVLPEAAP